MKYSSLVKTSVVATSFFLSFLAFASSPVSAEEGRCCFLRGTSPEKCTTQCYTDRQVKNDCSGNGGDVPGGCHTCGPTEEATACGGSSGGNTNTASCTQAVYALDNPTNMTVGQTKNFYADGHPNGTANFAKMVATVVNVPLGGAAVATVAATSNPVCYSTNGNCRQNFRLTARNNGTALLNVTTQVKLCPACAVSGSCTRTITVNVGGVTALACKPGAKCTVQTLAGTTSTVGGTVNCSMPALSTAELNGGSASYQVQCTPYRGTVAQAVISKSSANGSFPSVYKMVKGVTEVRCSFRYCVTGSDKVTKCSDWGKAS